MEYFWNKNFNAEVITLLELTTFRKKVQFLSIDHGSNLWRKFHSNFSYIILSIWHLPNISTL